MANPPLPLRRCSQASIARELRLSQPAVSLALNGKRDQLRPETYARIWAHALAAGYRGKGIAMETSPLEADGLTHVGIIHAASELRLDPFFAAVQWATEELLAEKGIPVTPLGTIGRMRDRVIARLAPGGAAKSAVIIMGEVPVPVVAEFAARSFRIVTVGWSCPHAAPAVRSNEEEAVGLLLRRLKRAGHTDIVWFGRDSQNAPGGARFAPAAIAAREGMRLHVDARFLAKNPARDAGRDAAKAFFESAFPVAAKPTAVLCSDRSVAGGAIEAFRLRGIEPPAKLSVVALGCPEVAENDPLRVTSAGSEPAQVAAGIVELLLGDPTGAGVRHRSIVSPARLFIGNTDGPCAANYPSQKPPLRETRPLRAA